MTHSLPGREKLILVVEDEYMIRETLREALESDGYQVVTAVNGQDGLEKLETFPKPNLILLDMMMPIMGGVEFLHSLAKDVALAPIPVLVVSITADAKSNAEGLIKQIQGPKAFVKKPPDLDLLLKMVEKYTA